MSVPFTGTPPTYPVAELERRFYAFAIDRLIVWGLYAATAVACWYFLGSSGFWAGAGIVVGVAVLMTLVFSAVLGMTGSSPGKSLVGLRVVHHGTGTPIGFGRALLRSLVLGLSALPTFGLGLATLAWTAVADGGHRRRGWHDHISHGIVIDVRPAPPVAAEAEAPRHVVNLTAMRLIPAPVAAPTPTPAPSPAPTPAPRVPDAGSPSNGAPQPAPQQQPMQQRVQQPQQPGPPPGQQPPPQLISPPRPEQRPLPHTPRPSDAQPGPADDGRTVVRGAKQSTQQPNVSPQQAPAPSVRWRVTFDDGETFVVEGLTLVGRRPEPRGGEPVRHVVPLSSGDMSLSKTHAQFAPAPDGALVVMDRGSTNGSMLLRKGVARELTAGKPTTVIDGDTVRFGDREMLVSRER
ncbi:RDD family protein [Nocardioides sp. InS609-2]|uniref:RDD family protein n=1 Tax=Nocardioides sp. InS609-2 TaxID=2760705 RepID=UPI0020BE459F|nr:RDD family protein [Nocardioides sp. InS609-2]